MQPNSSRDATGLEIRSGATCEDSQAHTTPCNCRLQCENLSRVLYSRLLMQAFSAANEELPEHRDSLVAAVMQNA